VLAEFLDSCVENSELLFYRLVNVHRVSSGFHITNLCSIGLSLPKAANADLVQVRVSLGDCSCHWAYDNFGQACKLIGAGIWADFSLTSQSGYSKLLSKGEMLWGKHLFRQLLQRLSYPVAG